jgi:hypothetical protein
MTTTTTARATTSKTVRLTKEELNTAKGKLKAQKAIKDRRRVEITVEGLEAFLVASALGRSARANNDADATTAAVAPDTTDRQTITPMLTGVEVALTVAIVVGVVAVVGLVVVAVVCLDGMDKGYTVKARHRTNGEGFLDDEIYFILIPPAPRT